MTFSIDNLEIFFLILVRITTFIYSAPFFSMKNVPQKVKVGLSLFFSIILFQVNMSSIIDYNGVIGFAGLIVGEALAGLIIGFFANISYHILAFAGRMVDMEIGFSMVNEFDPVSQIQSTISVNFYSYFVMLMMMVTNLHHYMIYAIADTFKIIPLGKVNIKPHMYVLMVNFLKDYFIIGFRIILPIFAAILVVNIILAILAKVAPNMNMFVIGLQLKVFVGLTVFMFMAVLINVVAEFIFDHMIFMMKQAIEALL